MKYFVTFSSVAAILYFFLAGNLQSNHFTDDSPGPFPPLVEQNDEIQGDFAINQEVFAIDGDSIRVEPGFIEMKPGAKSQPIRAFFDRNGQEALVNLEILAPHLHESEQGKLSAMGELTISSHVKVNTEFLVRARLRKQPDIFDDLIVLVRP